jgi:hypothetical protein
MTLFILARAPHCSTVTSGTLDMHSLIDPKFFQDYPNLVFHIFCYRWLDDNGEVDANAETISPTRSFGRTFVPNRFQVERLRSDGGLPVSFHPNQTTGAALRLDRGALAQR